MKYQKHFLLLTAAAIAAAFIGCNTDTETPDRANGIMPLSYDDSGAEVPTDAQPAPAAATDYSDRSNWGRFTEANQLTRDADIFILPGMASVSSDLKYAPIDHKGMRDGVNGFVNQVNGIAGNHANIYAPYYRQANAFSGGVGFYSGDAKEDIVAAFEYYYNTINKGNRPILMMGFSQGAAVLWEFTCDYMQKAGNETAAKNHVATYAIGAPSSPRRSITGNSRLKFSESYNDLHVLIHYNTYAEIDTSCQSSYFTGGGSNVTVTNPISWTTDENWHMVSENTALTNTAYTAARVYKARGVLLVRGLSGDKGNKACNSSFMGLHGDDIPFFSKSITANMGDRLAAWKAAYGSGTSSIKEYERVVR